MVVTWRPGHRIGGALVVVRVIGWGLLLIAWNRPAGSRSGGSGDRLPGRPPSYVRRYGISVAAPHRSFEPSSSPPTQRGRG
jgi:hypothetical protein